MFKLSFDAQSHLIMQVDMACVMHMVNKKCTTAVSILLLFAQGVWKSSRKRQHMLVNRNAVARKECHWHSDTCSFMAEESFLWSLLVVGAA